MHMLLNCYWDAWDADFTYDLSDNFMNITLLWNPGGTQSDIKKLSPPSSEELIS